MGDSRQRYRRLRDCIQPGVLVLFVGINPSLRSAQTGHHFAGYSNRFWKLLHESKLVSEPLTYREDRRLPEWRLGLTNIIGRNANYSYRQMLTVFQSLRENMERSRSKHGPSTMKERLH